MALQENSEYDGIRRLLRLRVLGPKGRVGASPTIRTMKLDQKKMIKKWGSHMENILGKKEYKKWLKEEKERKKKVGTPEWFEEWRLINEKVSKCSFMTDPGINCHP